MKALNGKAGDEIRALRRGDDGDAVRLVQVGGDFCQHFVVGDARRGGKPGRGEDFRAQAFGDAGGGAVFMRAVADVQIGFIERKGFDGIGDGEHQRADLQADGAVHGKARRREDELRATLLRAVGGHGGMDAIAARFVAGSGNHAAFFRGARDDKRLAAPFGVVALLHRGVEGIHVDVDDFTW